MPLIFNSTQVRQISKMCFELPKGLLLFSIAPATLSPFPIWLALVNNMRLLITGLFLFYLSLKLLENLGGEKV